MTPVLPPTVIILIQARWRLMATIGVFAVLSLLLALVLPKTYEATTTILPAPLSANGSQLMLQSPILQDLQRLASSAGGESLSGQGLMNVHLALLKSRTLQDRLIAQFDLATVYGADSLDEARNEFARHLAISITPEDAIAVRVRDHDASRAARIANALAQELAAMAKDFTMTTAKRNRLFLEGQLKDAEKTLQEAEQALTRFQQEHNLIALEEQVKAAVEADAALQASLTSAQVELQVSLQTYGPAHPEVVRLRAHLDELETQIRSAQRAAKQGARPSLSGMAAQGQRLAALIRDVRTHETIHFLILQQYEQARLAEAQQGDLMQTLDEAVVPTDPVFPKLWLTMVVAVALGTLGAAAWILLHEWQRRCLGTLPPAWPLWTGPASASRDPGL